MTTSPMSLSLSRTETKTPSPMSGVECISPVRMIFQSHSSIPYFPIKDLLEMYPLTSQKLGEGVYGKVLKTTNGFAVKITDGAMYSFLKELNFYASVTHDCIIKPVAWSYDKNKYYLVMPKGMELQEAFDEGKITFDEIIADSMSAVAFIHSVGLAHCDIKNTNFLVINGRVVLIDPGIASPLRFGEDGKHYLLGEYYSGWFRDPEFLIDDWSDSRCELYALAMMYYSLPRRSRGPDPGNFYDLTTGNATADWILERILVPISERPTIAGLLSEMHLNFPSLRKYTGFSHTSVEVAPGDEINTRTILFEWLCEVAISTKIDADVFFLAVSLIQRSLNIVLPKYTTDTSQLNKVQLLGAMCTHIAGEILGRSRLDYHFWVDSSNKSFILDQCEPMVMDIVNSLNCVIITPTYWNCASSAEDLVLLLQDSCCSDYNPRWIRRLTAGNNKNVTISTLYNNFGFNPKNLYLKRDLPHRQAAKIRPQCIKQTRWRKLLLTKTVDSFTLSKLIGIFLTCRDANFSILDQNCARDIYERFYDNNHLTYQVLDKVCKFSWRKYRSRFLSYYKVNPFTVTDQELDQIMGK